MRIITLFIILVLFSCTTSKVIDFSQRTAVEGKVIRTGVIDCFEDGLMYDNGTPVYCETSAALKIGNKILLGIDKPMPGANYSPVFTIPIDQLKQEEITKAQIQFITNAPFLDIQKIESFAAAPNDSLFFAATGFDRIKSTPEWDNYNALVDWSKPDFSDLEYVLPSQSGEITSSKILRSSIQNALKSKEFPEGPPYFKIEAMTVLPGNRLIFGIRESGKSYQDFSYGFTLLETTFQQNKFGVAPDPNFKKIYAFQPKANGHQLGISDIAYQPSTKTLIALTTFEGEGDEKTKPYGCYIWVLTMQQLEKGMEPILVKDGDQPLEIPYKGEGIVLLDNNTLFIVDDEDRKDSQVDIAGKKMTKKPNQTVFSIVKLR